MVFESIHPGLFHNPQSTKLFHSLVDYATVYHDGRMVFTFRNGTEIETKI